MAKVWDCTIFYRELEMLELRLNILNDVVDRFVIVEAGETHSGKPKPAYFAENRQRFAPFLDKIEYVYVPSLTEIAGDDSWRRERAHRSEIKRGLKDAGWHDWVIVADVDEIPHPQTVKLLHSLWHGCQVKFELDFYYYGFNYRVKQGWAIGAIAEAQHIDPNIIRIAPGVDGPHAHPDHAFVCDEPRTRRGWHFSYFMSPEQVADKLDAFMHHNDVAANVPRDPAWLGKQMSAGADIFGRGLPIEYVPLSDTLPAYVLANLDKYKHWIAQEAKA